MPIWIAFLTSLFITPLITLANRLFGVLLAIFLFIFRGLVTRHKKIVLGAAPKPPSQFLRFFYKVRDGLNFSLGFFEYYARAPRNYGVGTFLVFYLIYKFVLALGFADPFGGALDWIHLGALALVFMTIHHEVIASLKMAEFLRTAPTMDPATFFHSYYRLVGPFSHTLPSRNDCPQVSSRHFSCRQNVRPRQKKLVWIRILWDTAHLAHISLRALKFIGPAYARQIFDVMAAMWGKRLIQDLHADLHVVGGENVEGLAGKNIIVMNHKSQLDFGLCFFALSHLRLAGGRKLRPRFIVAKDHFVDNPLVYDWIGIGKLIESVHMVFIDRTKTTQGFQSLSQAAQFLLEQEIDIAIYPQGTRAEGNTDRTCKRRDAGYYTTISPRDMDGDLSHLKKGAAYLAVDVLLELLQQKSDQPLNLIFVGISGTAVALAKQSSQVQLETDFHFNIGRPLTLTAEMVRGLAKPQQASALNPAEEGYLKLVNHIHAQIDSHLAACIDIQQNLQHRFLVDLQGHFRFSNERIEQVGRYINTLSQKSSIVYQILDRIYACKPAIWNPHLSELAQLLMEECPVARLQTLRLQVSVKMLEGLKKKVHGQRVKKRELQLPLDQRPIFK